MVEDPLQHRRYEKDSGGLVPVDEVNPLAGIESLLHDEGIAGIEAPEDAERAADVVQRDAHHVGDRTRVRAEGRREPRDAADQHPVGDRHGFGCPRGPAREQDEGGLVAARHRKRIGRHRVRPEDLRRRHEIVPDDGAGSRGEGITHKGEAATAAGREQGLQLGGTERRIDQRGGSADAGGRDDAGHRHQADDIDDRHAVARLHAGFEEGGGDPTDGVVEFSVRTGAAREEEGQA